LNSLKFEELKEIYSKRRVGCGRGNFGKIYIPTKTTQNNIITPVTKYSEVVNQPKLIRDKKGTLLLIRNYTEIQKPKYQLENNVTTNAQILNYLCNNISCSYCRKIIKNHRDLTLISSYK